MSLRERGDALQLFEAQHAAGGIARRVEHDGAGLRRHPCRHCLRVDPEAVFFAAGHIDRQRAGQADAGVVSHPGRGRDQHLITGVEAGLGDVENAFLDADGDHHIVNPDCETVVARKLGGDRCAQLRQAGAHRIDDVGAVLVHGRLAGRLDVGRCVEIRCAGGQADHRLAGRTQLLDAVGHREGGRGRNRRHPGGLPCPTHCNASMLPGSRPRIEWGDDLRCATVTVYKGHEG